MKGKYVNNILVAATLVISLLTLCFGIYEHRREHQFRCDILHAKLQLNNYTQSDSTIRVTIIDTTGKVLYDSQKNSTSQMGNHMHRKEVQDALHTGSGYDIKRTSETDGESYFYSATYFPDRGVVVRSAVPYTAAIASSLERDYTFFYYTFGILLLLTIVLLLNFRLKKSRQEQHRIKRQLTENAAHELKTPAATIEGYLETLTEHPDLPEEQRIEFISNCYAQSRRMSSLLADMSTLTRLDEVSLIRPTTPVDVAAILRQIHEETREQFQASHIESILNIPDTLPMQGDESLLYSLFRNVFNNTLAYAIGATRFEVTVKTQKNRYCFHLADNGIGVPPEHIEHLFERFYRIDKGRSRQLGGTGLGLAIVKNIALQYGGFSLATETPGGGLTITIELAIES